MKQFLSSAFILGLLFTVHFSAKASHLVGAEFSYTCTATPGIWQVTLVLYRDCAGIPMCSGGCGAPCTRTVNYGPGGSCTPTGNFIVSLVSVSDMNFNPQCPNSKSVCNNMGCVTPGSYTPGIEKYVFQGNVDLGSASGVPPSCCEMWFSYGECCRNGDINTGLAGSNFIIRAMINRCLSQNPCNSSPQYLNDPFAVVCNGQPVIYNLGGIDPDHDSLSYSFAEPDGGGITYIAPYSYTSPLPHLTPDNAPFPYGMRCDSITGNIMFTPVNGGSGAFVAVVAVMIKQWKKISGVYQLMGKTFKDFQVWIVTCAPDQPPTFQTIPSIPLNNYSNINIKAYKGIPLCFDVIAKDTDFVPLSTPLISDTTYLSWDNSLAAYGATFTPNYVSGMRKTSGPREDNWKFCWTPLAGTVSNLPYIVNIASKDSRCPNPGRRNLSVLFSVSDSPVISISKTYLNCSHQISFSSSVPNFISNYQWQISNTKGVFNASNFSTYNTQSVSNLSFPDTGKYAVRLLLNQGTMYSMILYDSFSITNARLVFNPSVNDTAICKGNSVNFYINASGGKPPYSYRWFLAPDTFLAPLNAPFLTLNNFTVSPNTTTRYTMQLRDLFGCRTYDSNVIVTVNPAPVSILPSSNRICFGSVYNLDAGNNAGKAVKYLWNTGDTTRTIVRSDSNLYIVTLTDSLGCKLTDSLDLYVNNKIIADAGKDSIFCGSKIFTIAASGGQNYQWRNLNTNTIIQAKSAIPSVSISATTGSTDYEVRVYSTQNGVECSNTDTVRISSVNNTTVSIGSTRSFCSSDPVFNLTLNQGTTPAGGIWTGNSVSLTGTNYFFDASSATLLPLVNRLYYSLNNPPCYNSDSVLFSVSPKPAIPVITGNATAIIAQSNSYTVANSTGNTFNWFASNGTINSGNGTNAISVVFNITGNASLKVVETANANCKSDTASKTISVINSTGTLMLNATQQFNIYPNPANTELNIELGNVFEETTLELIDVLGKTLVQKTFHVKHNFSEKLDVSGLARGMYFISIKVGEQQIKTKVVFN